MLDEMKKNISKIYKISCEGVHCSDCKEKYGTKFCPKSYADDYTVASNRLQEAAEEIYLIVEKINN